MSQGKSEKTYLKKRKKSQRGPLLIALGGILILAVALFAFIRGASGSPKASIEVKGSPSLKVDKDKVDLGDVKLGQVVNVSFDLTNVGDQPLKVEEQPYIEVVEGCWPPEPTIGSMVLKPGEKTTLSMEFMMHGDMGGKHNFRVHVKTNDPKTPDHNLTVLSNWVQ